MPPKRNLMGTPSSEGISAKRSRPQEDSPEDSPMRLEASDHSSLPSTSKNRPGTSSNFEISNRSSVEMSTPSSVDATDLANDARISRLEKTVAQIAELLGVPKSGTSNDSTENDETQQMETSCSLTSTPMSSNTPADHDIKGLSMDDMPPAGIVKLLYLATKVKRKRTSARKNIEETLAEKVGEVFLQALRDKSFNPLKNFIENQMSMLKDQTYSKKSDTRNWQLKSDFMSWYLSMKLLGLDVSSLDEVAGSVRNLCGIKNIDEVEGAFMNNENLVMTKICDLMTSQQVIALWEVCSEEKKSMLPFQKIALDTPGMKELVFFYIIRHLELNQMFNTLYPDLLLKYVRKIRPSNKKHTNNLEQVCKILETYEILVRPVGYCLVFCVLDDRKGAQQEIENIKNTFGVRLGYKVVVRENPTEKMIRKEAKLCSESAALNIYDSFVCVLLAHGDPTDIALAGGKKISRKDFLQMFAKETCFPKKPKLFLMGSCQGSKVIPINRGTEKKDESGDAKDAATVPVPNKTDAERDIDTVHAESDRLVAYATLPEHAAFRNESCGSYFVTFICKQIEDLENQDDKSINVVEVLQRANRQIHSILFKNGDSKGNKKLEEPTVDSKDIQRLGKQACYYESTLQKNFCFRHL